MLRRGNSLTLRAAAIFISIYLATFVAGLAVVGSASLSSAGERHHAGPDVATAFALDDLRLDPNGPAFRRDGAFARLAARNRSLWLIVEADTGTGRRRFAFGPVPAAASRAFGEYRGIVEAAKFHVPGIARPWSDAVVSRRDTAGGDLWIAAGGIDPATISLGDSFRYFLTQGLLPVLLALGLMGLIAMLVALPLLTRALRPLTADVEAIRPDRPDRRIRESEVPRELLPLARGLNAALDRLSDELTRRKRFIADVAHELRTPLAILSLQIEALQAPQGKEDLRRIVARLSQLVAQMLDVERLSMAARPGREIDLAEIAREVVTDMAPLALAAGYEIGLDSPAEPVMVAGDPQALGRALANLVGNAVAHGGGAGNIRVAVGEDRSVEVSDGGPGIPQALRPQLFEPFSRARWDRDGCGLGLHLTREIMRAHGGEARLVESASGACFRLEFPG